MTVWTQHSKILSRVVRVITVDMINFKYDSSTRSTFVVSTLCACVVSFFEESFTLFVFAKTFPGNVIPCQQTVLITTLFAKVWIQRSTSVSLWIYVYLCVMGEHSLQCCEALTTLCTIVEHNSSYVAQPSRKSFHLRSGIDPDLPAFQAGVQPLHLL